MFDEGMSYDIFLVKLYYTQSFDVLEPLDGVAQTGFLGGGQVHGDGRGPGLAGCDGVSWPLHVLFPSAEGREVNQMALSPGKPEVNSIIFLRIIHL